jgi:hypothetical protein
LDVIVERIRWLLCVVLDVIVERIRWLLCVVLDVIVEGIRWLLCVVLNVIVEKIRWLLCVVLDVIVEGISSCVPEFSSCHQNTFVGRDSSVGITTRYRLDGPGIESR